MAILGVLGIIFLVCLPIAIVILIIMAAVNRDKDTSAQKFEKAVRTIYLYLVIITSLCIIIVGSISAVSSLLDYIMPASLIKEEEVANTIYREDYPGYYMDNVKYQERQVQNERNQGIVGFSSNLALVIVAVPIFVYHGKQAKKLRTDKK